MKILTTEITSKFNCLQGDCPDTCCKGWSMQVDDTTFAKYKGTELENAIAYDGQDNEIRVMKRDSNTDYCIKFTDGICGIHASKGADMLGDACYFYPRVTRKFGDKTIMTATLSCPEITRLALEGGGNLVTSEVERIPQVLKDYADGDLEPEQMLKIQSAFLVATEVDAPAERMMARIYSAIESLQHINRKDWEGAAPFMLKMADSKLPAPDANDVDKYYLLQVFAAIFHATRKKMNQRLQESISYVENYLGIRINWETLNLDPHPGQPVQALAGEEMNRILKRYLAAQMSFSSFPFAGLGETAPEKARLLAFKFALMKLFIGALPAGDDSKVIQSIQSVARIIDHLGSPELLFSLMNQFGWNTEARLRGLIGDS